MYVVGYSLPEEDIAFRSLVAAVVARWNEAVTVDVWNPDAEVGRRADRMFGAGRVTMHQTYASSFRFR